MDPWFILTQLGLPEGWACISLAMAIAYILLRKTAWRKPSPERRAFKRVTVLLTLALILSFVSVHAIKETTRIPRPCTPCPSPEISACNPYCTENDFSFPSGHAAAIFAAATSAFLAFGRRREALLLYVPAVMVAYSRVALGVHTFPDILAGSLIGAGSALLVWRYRGRLGILA